MVDITYPCLIPQDPHSFQPTINRQVTMLHFLCRANCLPLILRHWAAVTNIEMAMFVINSRAESQVRRLNEKISLYFS